MRNIIFSILLLSFLGSCIEPFEPELGEYESILVVDGLLTDADRPALVRLTRSFDLGSDTLVQVSGANLVIEEQGGFRSTLIEIEEGVYQTDTAQFRARPGQTYRLLIQTPDGNEFESDWQKLLAAAPIGALYFELEERSQDDTDLAPIRGIQFYLNTENESEEARHYFFDWEETYMYNNPKPPFFTVEFPNTSPTPIFSGVPFSEFEGLNCWKTTNSKTLILANTENLAQNQIEALAINFVDDSTPRLYLRYSLLVRQYAISKNYHEFLRKVEQINESTGSLFDPIPNEVFGNIQSTNRPDIPVLGYFGVAGQSEKRIFIERADIPVGFLAAPPGPLCREDTVLRGNFNELEAFLKIPNRIFHNYWQNDFGATLGYLITDRSCSICADNAASNKPPDFW